MIKNKKIIIDIAIIPTEEIINQCIFINSQLDNTGYISFKDGYYPHITLGMGCVLNDDLDNIFNEIKFCIEKFPKSIINIIGYEGNAYFSLEVGKNDLIINLHEEIMNIFKKYSHYGDAKKEMFYESENVKENSGLIKWVNNFETDHAHDKYDPHISLGEGERPNINFPFSFMIDKIGVFHLGVHGSCKKKIKEFNF